jgi:hypothetical protein
MCEMRLRRYMRMLVVIGCSSFICFCRLLRSDQGTQSEGGPWERGTQPAAFTLAFSGRPNQTRTAEIGLRRERFQQPPLKRAEFGVRGAGGRKSSAAINRAPVFSPQKRGGSPLATGLRRTHWNGYPQSSRANGGRQSLTRPTSPEWATLSARICRRPPGAQLAGKSAFSRVPLRCHLAAALGRQWHRSTAIS